MEVCRKSSGLLLLLGLSLLASTLQGVQGEVESEGPSESECRPFIEKALKELETGEPVDTGSSEPGNSKEDIPTVEITNDDSDRQEGEDDNDSDEDKKDSTESVEEQQDAEKASEQENANESDETADDDKGSEEKDEEDSKEQGNHPIENEKESEEAANDEPSKEESKEDKSEAVGEKESVEQTGEVESKEEEKKEDEEQAGSKEDEGEGKEEQLESTEEQVENNEQEESKEQAEAEEQNESKEQAETEEEQTESEEQAEDKNEGKSEEDEDEVKEEAESKEGQDEGSEEGEGEAKEEDKDESVEGQADQKQEGESKEQEDEGSKEEKEESKESKEVDEGSKGDDKEDTKSGEDEQGAEKGDESKEDEDDDSSKEKVHESKEDSKEDEGESTVKGDDNDDDDDDDDEEDSTEVNKPVPEEELGLDTDVPSELRPREHVEKLLKLDEESSETEKIINRVSEITLKELKKLYENAIKPLEVLYKYRDLSNRHFGDAEIFSKPLILFMGPWSGGKSSIINYLVNNEYNETSLKTGAEPSPAYFNILMYGEEPEIVEGTELAADFTFSGLQKFGQGLEERLRGVKLPNKLLEKVNIVEIPGILEVRKQVSRMFPFNDACQWFIDRADIIFLVYDPSKLDVGPETEAILDQLKGREHQTRIILNKADQVKPEELMRVQGALIWNISPLMSSPQPPTMYTTSLWSRPYEPWAPVRLLQAQERAFLRDLRSAIDKRIENKIASARRFAVRVRNHAKMVDCYLTTYYNHKSVFGNRKQVADEIIEHPQDYHIYEGLSTLTNISRYDLPDPEVYKDFFKLNPLYDFQQLSATCTYFRGCPINRLDVAIAYDLPELVGTHKKLIENALAEAEKEQSTAVPGS